jgi:hypothetical protein
MYLSQDQAVLETMIAQNLETVALSKETLEKLRKFLVKEVISEHSEAFLTNETFLKKLPTLLLDLSIKAALSTFLLEETIAVELPEFLATKTISKELPPLLEAKVLLNLIPKKTLEGYVINAPNDKGEALSWWIASWNGEQGYSTVLGPKESQK